MNKHLLKCWLWKGMWALGVVCLLAAWYSVLAQVPIWKFDALWLVWNALILGVLALPVKLDCHDCKTCNVNHPRNSGPMV